MNLREENRTFVLEVRELTVAYNHKTAIEDVEFRLESPGLIQIIGPNGAGKTTLLKAILGLVRPIKGEVLVDGLNVTGSPGKIGKFAGYLPQNPHISMLSPITVWELVEGGLLMRMQWPRRRTRLVADMVEKTLINVGLDKALWDKRLWELSGGQRQRAFLARAIVHDPIILVLDEPLAAVDPKGRSEIASLIGKLARERLVIVAVHEPQLLLPYTKEIILIDRRVVARGRPSEVLREELLARVYGGSIIQGILVGEGGAHG
ncbi:MAG: metal ABC transporter ATP-binding protein [Desulfurococcales archaeon]|nr:metal ABC transporter ATP-binding protein [Desulfurococcales archaeon]